MTLRGPGPDDVRRLHAEINRIVRTYSAYLALHQSGWEEDWQRYRRRFFHMGYGRIQGTVFITLGFLAAIFPIYLFGIRALWEQYPRLTAELCLALALYQVVVIGRAMLDWPDRARRERLRWNMLQAESSQA